MTELVAAASALATTVAPSTVAIATLATSGATEVAAALTAIANAGAAAGASEAIAIVAGGEIVAGSNAFAGILATGKSALTIANSISGLATGAASAMPYLFVGAGFALGTYAIPTVIVPAVNHLVIRPIRHRFRNNPY